MDEVLASYATHKDFFIWVDIFNKTLQKSLPCNRLQVGFSSVDKRLQILSTLFVNK